MKKKTTFLILTIATILFIGNVTQVFAGVENDASKLVSLEEYDKTMTELYKKYDLNFEIVESSNYVPITRNELLSEFEKIEKELMETVNTYNENIKRIEKAEKRSKLMIDNQIAPLIMPVTHFFRGFQDVSVHLGLAYVTIRFSASAVRDESNGYYISLTPDRWYHSSSMNLDEIVYERKEWKIRGKQVIVHAEGIAKFTYKSPINVIIKAEKPFWIYRTY